MSGMFWSFLGSLVGRGALVLSGIVAARLLGKEAFGALGILQNTILMFGIFAGFGIGITATKYIAEYRIKDPDRAGRILALSLVVAIGFGSLAMALLCFFSPKLARATLAAPYLSTPLRISSVLFLFTAISGAQTGILSGLESFKKSALVNLWTGALTLVINITLIMLYGFYGAVWGLVISSGIGCLISHFAILSETKRLRIPINFDQMTAECGVLLRFSLPAVVAGLVPGPVRWLCSVMLVNRPGGYSEMGVFNAANQWAQIIIFLSTVVASASIPILSERLGANDIRSSFRILKVTMVLSVILVLPLVLLGSILSPWIMGAYGKTFQSAWPTLVILLLASSLLAVQIPVGNMIQASGRMWTGALMNWGSAVVLLALTWITLSLGALGLSIAVLGSYIANGVLTFGYAGWMIHKFSEVNVE